MLRRHLGPPVQAVYSHMPVVLVNGPRRAGKTTLVQACAEAWSKAEYVTLDDRGTLGSALSDPDAFVAGDATPLIIDEVQRAPDLFRAIKLVVDRRRKPGCFVLTGSANVLLLPRLSESLAGRMAIETLWPFSQGEIESVREGFVDAIFAEKLPALRGKGEGRDRILRRVVTGGFPEAQGLPEDLRSKWFDGYVTTVLERDVRDLARIEGLAQMPRILALLAARAGAVLNVSELSRAGAMPGSTLGRYLALFEATYLMLKVPAWSTNLSKRLIRSPKVYLGDSGLLAHLVDASRERIERFADLAGPLVENFVALELRKQLSWSRSRAQVFHYRTLGGQEVDFVVELPRGDIVGIEVKSATSVTQSDFRGLHTLQADSGRRFVRGVVLYAGAEALPWGPKMHALPIDSLWRLGAEKAD